MEEKQTSLPSIILCGYERGGTTLLSQIFRENGYVSGFEVGVLLCESPKHFLNFKPYVDMLPAGWGLGQRISMEELCKGDFAYFYRKLLATAYPRYKNLPCFDKTPAYMSRLGYVLSQTEFINKAVVITRDPRAVFVSWAKRALGDDKASPKNVEKLVLQKLKPYTQRYLEYFYGCIAHRNNPSVHFVAYEQLCINSQREVSALGRFACNESFSLALLTHKFNNVYGDHVSTENVLEFDRFLSASAQTQVLEANKFAANFFCDVTETLNYLWAWQDIEAKVISVLEKYDLANVRQLQVGGEVFEPETYLFKNQDVLQRKANPVDHYIKFGKGEGRLPC